MENVEHNQDASRRRGRSQNRSEGPAYEQVANKAVYKEADYKVDTKGEGPSVSTTVVGENVTFTQNFNF